MNETKSVFKAPWSKNLTTITITATIFMFFISFWSLTHDIGQGIVWKLVLIDLPIVVLILAALFIIKRYEIHSNKIVVKRVFKSVCFSFDDILDLEHDPSAMDKSIRYFGNGGLFSVSGRFKNEKLGNYIAYSTNAINAVVIRLIDKTVVITPENPLEFVKQANKFIDKKMNQ